ARRADQAAASLSFFSGRTLTLTEAGLAANHCSSLVNGLMPLRRGLAGTLTAVTLNRPRRVKLPTPFLLIAPETASSTAASTALTSLATTPLVSDRCLIRADLPRTSFSGAAFFGAAAAFFGAAAFFTAVVFAALVAAFLAAGFLVVFAINFLFRTYWMVGREHRHGECRRCAGRRQEEKRGKAAKNAAWRTNGAPRGGSAPGRRPGAAGLLALGDLLPGLALARRTHHFPQPAGQDLGIGLLLGLAGKGVVRAGDAALGQGAGAGERGGVVLTDHVRHGLVVLGLHQQHVALEVVAGAQGAVFLPGYAAAAERGQVGVGVQLALGQLPALVLVDRRRAQGQPAHRAQPGQQGGQVAAVADADHGDGRRVHVRARGEPVVGGDQVGQVLRAADRFPLRRGFLVAAQVEGQADAADAGD